MATGLSGIGLSALQGYQTALDATANNIANAATNGFVPARAVFNEAAPAGNGVFVTITPQGRAVSSDTASQTDLAGEMINLLTYKVGYQAAAKVVQTQNETLGSLLDTQA